MRKTWIAVVLLATLGQGQSAFGGGPVQGPTGYTDGGYCDACDPCACGRHGHHCGLFGNRNPDAGFNCGCNGSYKFPVPPLYTYHWPGMYQQVLMTDYHSPWRFPPLKPYVDEVPPEVQGSTSTLRRVQAASAISETAHSSRAGSFSAHLEESLR
jgi:hypothetical protein